jgi:hypothetical protein
MGMGHSRFSKVANFYFVSHLQQLEGSDLVISLFQKLTKTHHQGQNWMEDQYCWLLGLSDRRVSGKSHSDFQLNFSKKKEDL